MKYSDFLNISSESSSHDGISVKRFIRNGEFSSLTNFSVAELKAGQKVEKHAHLTMNEFFYVLEGSGEMILDGNLLKLSSGKVIAVSAKEEHQLIAHSNLRLLYFGIET